MKKYLLLIGFLTTAGCSGLNYALDNYSGIDPQRFEYGGQTFRIFDKPEDGRLMITPSLGRAFTQGATFGAAATAEASYANAAQAYLNSTDRRCSTSNVLLIVQPQYEVYYACR